MQQMLLHREQEIINCAQLIRKDIVLKSFTGEYCDSAELQNRKNFLKEQIYNILDKKTVGKSIFIETNEFDFVLPALMAIWELGCNVFVHDSFTNLAKIPEFKSFWDFISVNITTKREHLGGLQVPTVFFHKYNTNTKYPSEYVLDQHVHYSTVAVKTHSSGTTGFPKLVDFTHRLVIERVLNHIKWDNIDENQRPLHFKTLHHGSLFIEFALPLLAQGIEHHWISLRSNMFSSDTYNGKYFLQSILPYLKQHKITKIMILYDWLDSFSQVDPIDLDGEISFCCFKSPTADSSVWIMENINPKEIINMFGCSELGTMFQSRCTKQNYKSFVPTDFTEIAQGLEYKIYPKHIKARWAGYPWHTLSDEFVEQDGVVKFRSRIWSVIVNQQTVYINELEEFLGNYYNTRDFTIAPNFETSKIYLAIYNHNIPLDLDHVNHAIKLNLSENYMISGIKYFDIYGVVSGIKPSGTLILHSFRNI